MFWLQPESCQGCKGAGIQAQVEQVCNAGSHIYRPAHDLGPGTCHNGRSASAGITSTASAVPRLAASKASLPSMSARVTTIDPPVAFAIRLQPIHHVSTCFGLKR